MKLVHLLLYRYSIYTQSLVMAKPPAACQIGSDLLEMCLIKTWNLYTVCTVIDRYGCSVDLRNNKSL